jgi:hypothetical protein
MVSFVHANFTLGTNCLMVDLASWEDLGTTHVARFITAQSNKTPPVVTPRDFGVMHSGDFS